MGAAAKALVSARHKTAALYPPAPAAGSSRKASLWFSLTSAVAGGSRARGVRGA